MPLCLVNLVREVSLSLLTNYHSDNFFRDEIIFSTAGNNYCAIGRILSFAVLFSFFFCFSVTEIIFSAFSLIFLHSHLKESEAEIIIAQRKYGTILTLRAQDEKAARA
jgi:hypothetical protein